MTKNAYWRKREAEQLKHYISEDTKIQKIMSEKYDYMLRQIEVQINDFYARYARAEKITLAEAQQRVAKMDVQAFSSKAKKYVKEKDFSPQANKELRLYNATMRINRLELLKANIGLEMVDGFNDIEKTLEQGLSKRTSDELKRQERILRSEAGILNTTVFNNAKTVQSIVNASFQNATWSTRIWGNQSQLRDSLSALLTNGLIQGKNPLQLAPALRDLFGASRKAAERLMITEMARVQTDAQMESFKRNDIEEYVFISVDTACSECMAMNGQHFRVSEMAPGENAPPIHPRCRCSTAAYVNREAVEREVFGKDYQKPAFGSISNQRNDYNENARFDIDISGIGSETKALVNKLCKECIDKGHKDGFEHGYTVDIRNNEVKHYTSKEAGEVFGEEFFSYIANKPPGSIITIHDHSNNKGFSYIDINTYTTETSLKANIAACHNGGAFIVEGRVRKLKHGDAWSESDAYDDIKNRLKEKMKNGTITVAEYAAQLEEESCKRMADLYFKRYKELKP